MEHIKVDKLFIRALAKGKSVKIKIFFFIFIYSILFDKR